jgi:glutaredoxin
MKKANSLWTKRTLLLALALLLGLLSAPVAMAEGGLLGGGLEGATLVANRDDPQVELFVTSWCPYCKKAINFFRSHDIPYVVYDIEKNPVAARRKQQLDSSPGVPFALINGHKVHGYSEEAYSRALGLR